MEARALPGLVISPLGFEQRTAKFDLLLNLTEGPAGIQGRVEYTTDLYEPATIARLVERFGNVLETIAGQPDIRLSEIVRNWPSAISGSRASSSRSTARRAAGPSSASAARRSRSPARPSPVPGKSAWSRTSRDSVSSPQQQHLWRVQRSEQAPASSPSARSTSAAPSTPPACAAHWSRRSSATRSCSTSYHLLPGMTLPVQVVGDQSQISFAEEDLERLPAGEREAAVERLLDQARDLPFDLSREPVLRATLARLGDAHHALLVSLPALAADEVSLRNLAAEIADIYADEGAEAAPEELLQYADAAEILHEWLAGEDAGVAYWRHQDLSVLRRLTAAAAGSLYAPQVARERLDAARAGRLRAAAARLGCPESLVLLAVWHAALESATGEGELVVGTFFNGRTVLEFERALGFSAATCRCVAGWTAAPVWRASRPRSPRPSPRPPSGRLLRARDGGGAAHPRGGGAALAVRLRLRVDPAAVDPPGERQTRLLDPRPLRRDRPLRPAAVRGRERRRPAPGSALRHPALRALRRRALPRPGARPARRLAGRSGGAAR